MKCLIFDTETSGLPPTWKLDKLLDNDDKEWRNFINEWPYLMQLTFIIYDTENMVVEQIYDKYIEIPDEIMDQIQKEIENNKQNLKKTEKMIEGGINIQKTNISIENCISETNSTGYRGVRKAKNKFSAIFQKKYLGTFDTPQEAALEYAYEEIKKKELNKLEKDIQKKKKTISILQGNLDRLLSNEKISIEQANSEFNLAINNSDLVIAHNINFDFLMMIATAKRDSNPKKYISDLLKIKKNNKMLCTMFIVKNQKKLQYPPSLTYSYNIFFGYEPNEENLHDSLYDVIITLRLFIRIITGKDIYRLQDIKGKKYTKQSKSYKVIEVIRNIIPKHIKDDYPLQDIEPFIDLNIQGGGKKKTNKKYSKIKKTRKN